MSQPTSQRSIVFVGNCQAAALCNVYRRCGCALDATRVSYIDIADLNGVMAQSRDALAAADFVVLQEFDNPATLAPVEAALSRKPLKFPAVMGGFYWPYGSQPHPKNASVASRFSGPYPAQHGDRFLNNLIRKGVGAEEALRIYLETDIVAESGLDRLFELGLERQRSRDARTGLDIASVIRAHFASEPLFLSPDHPTLRVFNAVAAPVFAALGADAAAVDQHLQSQLNTPFPLGATPIHPKVAAHFGLTFANETSRYAFPFEGAFTFAEYVGRYMAFEWNPLIRDAIEEPNPEIGLRKLLPALRESPNSHWGWIRLTSVLISLRRGADALATAAMAVRVAPHEPDAKIALCRAQLATHAVVAAEQTAAAVVAAYPNYFCAHSIASDVYLARGRIEDAVASARRAVQLAPADAHQHGALARVLFRADQRAEAELAIRAAIQLEPFFKDFQNFLAKITLPDSGA